jgi:heme exporter protein B
VAVTSETDENLASSGGCQDRLGRGRLPAFLSAGSPAASAPSSEVPRGSPPSLVRSFVAVVRRDLRLAVREGGDAAMTLGFFVLAVILFPFGVGPAPELLSRIGSGVVWVTALLAALLSLDRLFLADYEDGTLEALALSRPPLELIVMAKVLAHWIVTGLPLVLVAPILAFLMGIDPSGYGALVVAMALGTPTLSLIGAIGASLTLGARRGGVLVSLLVLPLYIPVLILGSGAVEGAISGLGARPHLLILGAIALAALPLAAVSTAAAVRLSLE